MKIILLILSILTGLPVFAQSLMTPLQINNYSRYTSYEELTKYVNQLDKSSPLLKVETIGKSVQGRNLYAMMFSSGEFGTDSSKIKVLLLAQQHGNEQSGKEGAMLLAAELLKPENHYLFDKIELAVVPQMNPDGSEAGKRLNNNEEDLNRNHLVLTEPEVIALHKFFDKYLFEASLDIHEYYPYGDSWKKYGYRYNTDEFIGPVNNPNIAADIMKLENSQYIPFMKKYLEERNFSNFIYCPGGPPGVNYNRNSTFDINDGRQSFGIQNTFSFIQEGLNAENYSTENIRHRAEGQKTGMRCFLEFIFQNSQEIKFMVIHDRNQMRRGNIDASITIQSEHSGNGEKLNLPVHSYSTNRDSVLTITDYRPVVKSIKDVTMPAGYLVPKRLKEVTDWINRQSITHIVYSQSASYKVTEYKITAIDSIDFEGDRIVNPNMVLNDYHLKISPGEYLYLPTAQLKGTMLVIALEPKSMLGLVTYKQFSHLLQKGKTYPILRVENDN